MSEGLERVGQGCTESRVLTAPQPVSGCPLAATSSCTGS